MLKINDKVRFTNQAQHDLGTYADNKVHIIETIETFKNWITVTFKDEPDSDTDITLLEKVN